MLYLGYDNAAHKSTSLGRCPTELPPLYGYRPPSSGCRHEPNINPSRQLATNPWLPLAYLLLAGDSLAAAASSLHLEEGRLSSSPWSPLVACSSWLGKSYSMAACWRRCQHLTTAGYAILHLLKELF